MPAGGWSDESNSADRREITRAVGRRGQANYKSMDRPRRAEPERKHLREYLRQWPELQRRQERWEAPSHPVWQQWEGLGMPLPGVDRWFGTGWPAAAPPDRSEPRRNRA